MFEKTPFQIMREIHKRIIDKQKQDADNRALAYQYGISFTNTADLNEKIEEKKAEQKRKEIERQIAEDERRANARRREEKAQAQRQQEYVKRNQYHDQGYTSQSSSGSSS